MNNEDREKKINQVFARALDDAGFKEKFLVNPTGTLQSEGIELSEDDLHRVSGGSGSEPNCPYKPHIFCQWYKHFGNEHCHRCENSTPVNDPRVI